jgi:hypothetical protein
VHAVSIVEVELQTQSKAYRLLLLYSVHIEERNKTAKRAHRLEDAALQEGDGVGVVLLLGLAVQLVRAGVAHLGQRQCLHKRLAHV